MLPITLTIAAMTHGLMIDYRYVPMPERYVAIHSATSERIGKLTEEGRFVEKWRYTWEEGETEVTIISSPGWDKVLNSDRIVKAPVVYDLQGEKLVPGRVTVGGAFNPDPKGETILFHDYQCGPNAPPIWNLPGEFRWLGAKPETALEKAIKQPGGFGGGRQPLPQPGQTFGGFWSPSGGAFGGAFGGGGGRGGMGGGRGGR